MLNKIAPIRKCYYFNNLKVGSFPYKILFVYKVSATIDTAAPCIASRYLEVFANHIITPPLK